MVLLRKKFFIDFKDHDGEILSTLSYDTERLRDEVSELLHNDDDHALWPQAAVGIKTYWRNQLPVRGLDYGSGSVKRRFGNGRVPRGAYRFGQD